MPEGHVALDNVLFAPLILQGKAVGLLGLANKPDGFTDDDAHMAFSFGELASVALMNSRTLESLADSERALRHHSERLEEMVSERTEELERTQAQLWRREKLAAIGQLAGGIGHELRNPLGVVSNAVYMLQCILPDADEQVREYLDMISEEAKGAARIVSDLMDFARTRPAERKRAEMLSLLARVLEKHPPPENIQVSTERVNVQTAAFIDPLQMEVVLGNLIDNAYQAMPDGGMLTISAKNGDDKISLAVQDTGFGIRKEHMDKLFEPLFTTKSRGTGLGLATSRSLIEANGGQIEVQSREGQGTTFTVILPAKEGPQ
jgi:signal transduction histidine kinase